MLWQGCRAPASLSSPGLEPGFPGHSGARGGGQTPQEEQAQTAGTAWVAEDTAKPWLWGRPKMSLKAARAPSRGLRKMADLRVTGLAVRRWGQERGRLEVGHRALAWKGIFLS